jgi:glucose-1-phosphate adenylyltransferase
VIDWIEKNEDEIEGYASMGLYLIDKDYLLSLFSEKNKNPPVDMVYDIIIPAVKKSEVGYYIHRGYWQDIGTLHRYYKANMDLLEEFPELNLHDRGWQILTRMKDEPPIRFIEDSVSKGSLICDGSIIKGSVVNSIISPSVIVEKGASVENSIIYENSTIKEGAKIKDSIIDKLVYVGEGASIGYNELDELKPYQKYGLTVIGKGSRIPDDYRIESGCTLDIFLTEGDFKESYLSSGSSIILTDDEAKNRGEHLLQ